VVAVGVIPARGGSAGIPRKNVTPVAGRPLIAWTIDAARASTRLTRTVVSTDDPEIAEVAREHGIVVPALRDAALAGAETPMLPVLLDALDREEADADIVVLLQPTSPLRRAEHIDGTLALLESSGADAVVSVVRVQHSMTPGSLLELDARGRVTPLDPRGALRRQDKPVLYARNGPAVYAARIPALRERGDLYGGVTVGYEMPWLDSFDVDDADDLALCELILAARG
jgi:CMP-N,N'-diacetyllegionaminic acid synthase